MAGRDYDDHFDDHHLYPYTYFTVLRTIALVCAFISLLACLTTIIVYALLRWLYKGKASRVSLRCVILSIIVTMIDAITDIVSMEISDLSPACFPLAVINQFCIVASTAFLTLIGVNLLLVFVFHLKHKKYLEHIYYSAAVLYSLASLALPIYYTMHPCIKSEGRNTCWFAVYYETSYCGDAVWTWLYSFLMFLVLFSAICSVIAMVKLFKESRIADGDLKSFGGSGSGETYLEAALRRKKNKRKRTSMVTKVVFRCAVYLLVPLVCFLWGFIFETILLRGLDPPFALSVMHVFLRNLMGVFMTIIFFHDPLVTTLMRSKIRGFIQKYLHEYYEIEVPEEPAYHDKDTTLCPSCHIPCLYHCLKRRSCSPGTDVGKKRKPIRCIAVQHHMRSSRQTFPSPAAQPPEANFFLSPEPRSPIQIIDRPSSSPLRSTSSSPCTRTSPRKFQSISTTSSDHRGILGIDPTDPSRIYVAYTRPRLAAIIHCVLVRVFRLRPEEEEEAHSYRQPSTPIMIRRSTSESDGTDGVEGRASLSQQTPMSPRMKASVYIPREPTVSRHERDQRLPRTQGAKRISDASSPDSLDTIELVYGRADSPDYTVVESATSSPEEVIDL